MGFSPEVEWTSDLLVNFEEMLVVSLHNILHSFKTQLESQNLLNLFNFTLTIALHL